MVKFIGPFRTDKIPGQGLEVHLLVLLSQVQW